jgi:para-nitrobenzyl esterase
MIIAGGPTTAGGLVETSAGKVRGIRKNGTLAFLGIPYGGDTSRCRFQPAKPPEPWRGVRDCFAFGPQAAQGQLNVDGMQLGAGADPQFTRAIRAIFSSGVTEQQKASEDCLVLNVYTPEAAPRVERPVMVCCMVAAFLWDRPATRSTTEAPCAGAAMSWW